MHGVEAATSDLVILFDADCRVPDSTALIDWYIKQFQAGAKLAYTQVDYYELVDHWSIRLRICVHHFARWVKRAILGIPISRGRNYAIDRQSMSELYKMYRYFRYRLFYNLRGLPVGRGAHKRAKRGHESVRKYENNNQVK